MLETVLETRSPARATTGASAPARRTPGARSSTPARLGRVGAVLVLGCVVLALACLVGGLTRTAALDDARDRVAALSADSAAIYSSLADADASATSGYVSGGVDPPALRTRYDGDVARAASSLMDAAGRLGPDRAGAAEVDVIGRALPVYTGTTETARAGNRQGLPLGRTYLAEASAQMRDEILPAAARLRAVSTAELADETGRGAAAPFVVGLLGLGVLAGIVDLSVREARRTRRVVSPGLVAGAGLVLVGLLWWVVATAVGAAAVHRAVDHAAATTALDDARAEILQARSAEGLALVARNGATDRGVTDRLADVLAPGGPLATAEEHGADVGAVRTAATAWQRAHDGVRAANDEGRYTDAAVSVTAAAPQSSGGSFAALDAALDAADPPDGGPRRAVADALDDARIAQTGLPAVPTALVVLAGAALALAVARRVGEYR